MAAEEAGVEVESTLDDSIEMTESLTEDTTENPVDSVAETASIASPEAPSAEEEVAPEGQEWYVVHCYSGYENKVKNNLE